MMPSHQQHMHMMYEPQGSYPFKLFIGGLTRNTTTRHLREHFSHYGRVLDCVAMRQPDGRARGFGYVTLDCHHAAALCISEPQVLDGRLVDVKPAVPGQSNSEYYDNSSYTQAAASGEYWGNYDMYDMDAAYQTNTPEVWGMGYDQYRGYESYESPMPARKKSVPSPSAASTTTTSSGRNSARGTGPAACESLGLLTTEPKTSKASAVVATGSVKLAAAPSGTAAAATAAAAAAATPSMSAAAKEFVPASGSSATTMPMQETLSASVVSEAASTGAALNASHMHNVNSNGSASTVLKQGLLGTCPLSTGASEKQYSNARSIRPPALDLEEEEQMSYYNSWYTSHSQEETGSKSDAADWNAALPTATCGTGQLLATAGTGPVPREWTSKVSASTLSTTPPVVATARQAVARNILSTLPTPPSTVAPGTPASVLTGGASTATSAAPEWIATKPPPGIHHPANHAQSAAKVSAPAKPAEPEGCVYSRSELLRVRVHLVNQA